MAHSQEYILRPHAISIAVWLLWRSTAANFLNKSQSPTLIFKPGPTPDRLDMEVESLPVDTKLYKYLSKQNAARLLEGNLRIGTLYDFRRIEHQIGVSDPDEGRKRLILPPSERTYTSGTPKAKALTHMGFDINGGSLRIRGVQFEREVEHPDVFVWCCSSVADPNILEEIRGTEECVEIVEAGKFFEILTDAINKVRPVKFLGFREVEYMHRDQPWNEADLGTSAAFMKEPSSFAGQREIRAVWIPLEGGVLEPICPLLAPDVTKLCSTIKLRDSTSKF